MNYEEIQLLAQLIAAMEEAIKKIEEYYHKRDIENFEIAKKTVLEFQQKIAQVLVSEEESRKNKSSSKEV